MRGISIQSKSFASPVRKIKARVNNFLRGEKIIVYISLLVIGFFILCAIVPEWIAPYPPTKMLSEKILQAPSMQHFLGTDYFGRDIFSLVVHGSKTSILIGVAAVLLGGTIGSLIGMIAGYVGGVLDAIFMRMIEILQTIPGVLLALALVAALGASFTNLVIAISISAVPSYARVMRGQIINIKSRSYILAAKSIGVNHFKVFGNMYFPIHIRPY